MKINRAYKTKLNPTRNQANYFKRCGRVARTVFNWILADYMKDYAAWYAEISPTLEALRGQTNEPANWKAIAKAATEAGLSLPQKPMPNGRVARKKKLNQEKKTDPKLLFLTEYPYGILENAADDFDSAMKNYLSKKKSGQVSAKIAEMRSTPAKEARYNRRYAKMKERGRVGEQLDPFFPRFKRKDDDNNFRFTGNSVEIGPGGNSIKLPRLGWIRVAENNYLPTEILKQCSVTISQSGKDWYISVAVEEDISLPELKPVTLGVSIGVIDLAATSTELVYENPQVYAKYAKKKERLQRELSRRSHKDADGKVIRGSNWKKTKEKLAKLEREIANVRRHHQHNATKGITGTLPSAIVVKDMDIPAMMQKGKRKVNQKMADAGMGEVRRQIEYKAAWKGIETSASPEAVAEVCSSCGQKTATINYTTKLTTCPCGHSQRASVNMAINLSRKGK